MNLITSSRGTVTDLNIETIAIHKAAWLLRAINHPLRQEIIRLIHNRGHLSVTDLQSSLSMSQPVVSQHLGILRKSGFVVSRRTGRSINYFINYAELKHVHKICSEMQWRQSGPRSL